MLYRPSDTHITTESKAHLIATDQAPHYTLLLSAWSHRHNISFEVSPC